MHQLYIQSVAWNIKLIYLFYFLPHADKYADIKGLLRRPRPGDLYFKCVRWIFYIQDSYLCKLLQLAKTGLNFIFFFLRLKSVFFNSHLFKSSLYRKSSIKPYYTYRDYVFFRIKNKRAVEDFKVHLKYVYCWKYVVYGFLAINM